ncbi:MAG: hypothetical protein EBZ50_02535 [Alphaproteobacteria bacterium]|nr:hypothetical protein [Alphaproteobacteria bacterium]
MMRFLLLRLSLRFMRMTINRVNHPSTRASDHEPVMNSAPHLRREALIKLASLALIGRMQCGL